MQYPADKMIIVFDIDGTILDMRFVILHVLKEFDKQHKTSHFKDIKVSDIDFHEINIKDLLKRLSIGKDEQEQILSRYDNLLISSMAVLEAHRPFRGVLDVIRWFQLQPNTFVGLNTGRPESFRSNTLKSLNRLAKEYRVKFRDDLLFMKTPDFESKITAAKAKGIEHFHNLGYRVFAFVDNEPENLQAVSEAFPGNEILLLHADTIFKSQDIQITGNAVRGKGYNISKLLSKKNLPKHIQFVWQWDGLPDSLQGFLNSQVKWIEIDLNSLSAAAWRKGLQDREYRLIHESIDMLIAHGKKIKINLSKKAFFSWNMPGILRDCMADNSSLWLYGSMNDISPEDFKALREMYPGAIIGCPIDILSALVSNHPVHAKELLTTFRSWGINRFSINWRTQGKRIFFNYLRQWKMETDIYNTSNLESFFQALLLLPDSVTMKPDFALKNEEEYILTERFQGDSSFMRKTA
jgi:phosphoglycolate phosphatase-like HAD superfamily hydrolase